MRGKGDALAWGQCDGGNAAATKALREEKRMTAQTEKTWEAVTQYRFKHIDEVKREVEEKTLKKKIYAYGRDSVTSWR